MIFVHCSKSAHTIGQNGSRVFRYLATTSRLSALLRITPDEKCALLKLSRSKASRKLYLQVDKAKQLKKISMNSTMKNKKKNNLENFYRHGN